jgi:hypothetical protein
MQTADSSAAANQDKNAAEQPLTLRKWIDSKEYIVSVHFSKTSKETLNDKILRLIRNEMRE